MVEPRESSCFGMAGWLLQGLSEDGVREELLDLLVSSCLRPEPLCRVLRFLLSRCGDVVSGSCAPQWQLREMLVMTGTDERKP